MRPPCLQQTRLVRQAVCSTAVLLLSAVQEQNMTQTIEIKPTPESTAAQAIRDTLRRSGACKSVIKKEEEEMPLYVRVTANESDVNVANNINRSYGVDGLSLNVSFTKKE